MFERMRNLLNRIRQQGVDPPPVAEPAVIEVAPEPVPVISDADFLDHVNALGDDSSVIAGSLELVGLEDIRRDLGDVWELVSADIFEIAKTEIARLLDPKDIFRPRGDTVFLICFHALDQSQADAKARAISHQIKLQVARLLPQVSKRLSIKTVTVSVPANELKNTANIADALYARLTHVKTEVQETARRQRAALLKDFALQFAPVLHVGKHHIVLNRCLLNTSQGCVSLSQFQAIANPGEIASTFAQLDLTVLTKSIEALHDCIRASGKRPGLIIPVSYDTLANEVYGVEYTRCIGQVPEQYLKNVVLELVGVPNQVVFSSLQQLVASLGKQIGRIALECALDSKSDMAFTLDGVWAVSVNLSGKVSTDLRLARDLRLISEKAHAAKLVTIAHGANSIGLGLAASEAGFSLIDGPAIHPVVAAPKPPARAASLQPVLPTKSGLVQK
jgi:hypothetical protein